MSIRDNTTVKVISNWNLDKGYYEAVYNLVASSERVSIITFGSGGQDTTIIQDLMEFGNIDRLILGYIPFKGKEGYALDQIQALRDTLPNDGLEVRLCQGSHIKLFLGYKKNRITAILGSMNLGAGSTYELGLEVKGVKTRKLDKVFQRLWERCSVLPKTVPVKMRATRSAYDLAGLKEYPSD